MSFFSILYENPEDDIAKRTPQKPECFMDLHLDQIITGITTGFETYNLVPFFYDPLQTPRDIIYRQEIMQELKDAPLFQALKSFSCNMQTMRDYLARGEKLHHKYQRERWFLDAVILYCNTIECLARDLVSRELNSRGFCALRSYLDHYTTSQGFISLVQETTRLSGELSNVRYLLLVQGNEITIRKNNLDVDYGREVERTFEKFLQDKDERFRESFPEHYDMNHVEAQVLDRVALLYPDEFSHLDAFQERHVNYLDNIIARFDREIQFYIAYLTFISPFQEEGLAFCIPQVSDTHKDIRCNEGFDLSLAASLIHQKKTIVCNDFYLEQNERIFVITGPNQGGKTTFARTFGQIHYLASLGCPVPGTAARLYLFDQIFTHFEREESITSMKSKLEDDLVRIHSIFTRCTTRSIIIINEMFTSTTIQDALFLGRKVLELAIERDLLCIYVTFLDELTLLEKTVSIASTINPDNPDVCTYKIIRKPADGLSYAIAIARKNRLLREDILERMGS